MLGLVNLGEHFVLKSPLYRQPVKVSEDRSDVVTHAHASDHPSGNVLDLLYFADCVLGNS